MRGRSSFRLMLVALAVLATLSHVCALPLHAEPAHGPAAPHATPTHTHAHGDDASCEAASSAPPCAVPALAAMAVAIAEPVLPVPASPVLAFRPVFSRASPLFVLFLTLRI